MLSQQFHFLVQALPVSAQKVPTHPTESIERQNQPRVSDKPLMTVEYSRLYENNSITFLLKSSWFYVGAHLSLQIVVRLCSLSQSEILMSTEKCVKTRFQ